MCVMNAKACLNAEVCSVPVEKEEGANAFARDAICEEFEYTF